MSSVDQHPKRAYYLIAENGALELGTYEIPVSGEIETCHFRILNRKTGSYSYTLQLTLHASQSGAVLASSEVATITETITGQTTDTWLGDVTLSFPTTYSLVSGDTFFIKLVIGGYTRTANTTYLGVWCDWLEPLGVANTAGARLAIGLLR